MTFEEFEKATEKELRSETKLCFDRYNDVHTGGLAHAALLLEAQFYIQELGRREDSRIARRDFWLEIIVIILIGAEIGLSIWGIVLGVRESNGQQALMGKQNGILTNLQTATADTAAGLKALTTVTQKMEQDTAETSRNVHDQVLLSYDPSIGLIYDGTLNRLNLMNTGRTRLIIKHLKLDDTEVKVVENKIIPAGDWVYVGVEDAYKAVSAKLPKGSTQSVRIEVHLENEIKKHFVVYGTLFFIWNNDKVDVHAQNDLVKPEP